MKEGLERIGLIACSARKDERAENDHSLQLKASEMYKGSDFKKAVEQGLSRFGCSRYFILSDLHKLLKPDDLITWYDCKNTKWKSWSDDVYSSLKAELGDLDNYEFIFFTPSIYYKYLKPRLKNCKAVEYNPRHMILTLKP